MNNSADNNASDNGEKVPDPSKNTFSCEIQLEQFETNIINNNHKRCSPLEIGVIKRSRSHVNSEYPDLNEIENIQEHNSSPREIQQSRNIQNSHLLQQLMAPTPQRIGKTARPKSKNFEENIKEGTQWNHDASLDRSKDQSSESVLKNLLVSGTDSIAGYTCNVPSYLKKVVKT